MLTQGFRFSFTPLPGCFSPFPHGTLRYRWPDVFSLRRWSSQIPPRFLVSRGTRVTNRAALSFCLRGSHPLWRAFPDASTPLRVYHCLEGRTPSRSFPQPPTRNGCSLTRVRFRLAPVRSPLLGRSWLLSLPPATKMVQFTGCPLGCPGDGTSLPPGFPIRKSRDPSLLAAPPSVSPLAASFIGIWPQGIHPAP